MNKIGIGIVLIILFTGAAIYYFINQPSYNQGFPSPSPLQSTDRSGSDNQANSSGSSMLRAGGNSYLHPNGNFSFLYPNDYKIGNEATFVRIYKNGPSQKGQTEMYDGVLMLFEPIDLKSKSLSQWVEENIEASTMDGTSKVTKPKAETKVNNYSGYSYSLEGLGESNHIVLQKDANSETGVHIITSVYDPTNAGFEQEVTDTLDTLEILK